MSRRPNVGDQFRNMLSSGVNIGLGKASTTATSAAAGAPVVASVGPQSIIPSASGAAARPAGLSGWMQANWGKVVAITLVIIVTTIFIVRTVLVSRNKKKAEVEEQKKTEEVEWETYFDNGQNDSTRPPQQANQHPPRHPGGGAPHPGHPHHMHGTGRHQHQHPQHPQHPPHPPHPPQQQQQQQQQTAERAHAHGRGMQQRMPPADSSQGGLAVGGTMSPEPTRPIRQPVAPSAGGSTITIGAPAPTTAAHEVEPKKKGEREMPEISDGGTEGATAL